MNTYLINTLYSLANKLPLDFPWKETLKEAGLDLRTVETERVILSPKDTTDRICFLVEGQVEVRNFSLEGKRNISAYLKGPQFLGLVEYLTQRRQHLSEVKTLSPAVLIYLHRDQMEKLLAHKTFHRYFLDYLAELTVNTLSKHSVERAMDPKSLLLNYLYQYAKHSSFPVEIQENKQNISDLLNIQIRTLYRYLRDFEDQGYLLRKKQSIYLTEENFKLIQNALKVD
ncbi:MAG: Crp/Fnr family transcriptional regulator [Tissierellia bacterium]|nr:Crp/Fnr family transcriptional regulator [Tissierellia bacterium]